MQWLFPTNLKLYLCSLIFLHMHVSKLESYCASHLPLPSLPHCLFTCSFPQLEHEYFLYAAAAAKSLQSCPTLCDLIEGSPSGSPVPGILQARMWEWVAISFSNAWKWKVTVKSLSCVRLLTTPWATAYQASPSMGFSRQEYWSRMPLPSPFLYADCLKCLCCLPQHSEKNVKK